MVKNLNMRPEIVRYIAESIGNKLPDIRRSAVFVGMSLTARETKAKINKWDHIKLKSFCPAEETISKRKRKLLNGKRYLQIIHLIGVNIQNIYRTHTTQQPNKMKQPDLKMGRGSE